MKQTIRLTESELKRLITESVNNAVLEHVKCNGRNEEEIYIPLEKTLLPKAALKALEFVMDNTEDEVVSSKALETYNQIKADPKIIDESRIIWRLEDILFPLCR